MSDWKGTEVDIIAFRGDGTGLSEEVQTVGVLLDTDTMADYFERFPPENGWVLVVGRDLHKALP